MFEQIINHFNEQIEAASFNTETLTPAIAEAATLLSNSLAQGTVFIVASNTCFSPAFELNRLLNCDRGQLRPSFPSVFINTNILSSGDNDDKIAKALAHLLKPNDLLIIFSYSGAEKSLNLAIEQANLQQANSLLISPHGNPMQHALPQQQQQGTSIILPTLNEKQQLQLQFSLSHLLMELAEVNLFGQVLGQRHETV